MAKVPNGVETLPTLYLVVSLRASRTLDVAVDVSFMQHRLHSSYNSNFNHLSRVHERYTDRQPDRRRHSEREVTKKTNHHQYMEARSGN